MKAFDQKDMIFLAEKCIEAVKLMLKIDVSKEFMTKVGFGILVDLIVFLSAAYCLLHC